MFTSMSNLRIFPRLLILFASLVIISSTAMVFLGFFYIQAEQTHAQAVKTSFNAQQIATTEQINLQRMNALLQARFAQIFASNNAALQGDPSLAASGGLIESDIVAREIEFDQAISSYDQTYTISSSTPMIPIRTILQSDEVNKHLIADQQVALDQVTHDGWSAYKQLQDQVLTQLLQVNPQYQSTYAILYQANLKFLDLQRSWQTVVDTATTVGQAVTDLKNSEIVPLQFATTIAIALIMLVIALTAIIVNTTISQRLRQLAALTHRIANGDTSERAYVGGRDEIQTVASSMNSMLDNIVQLIREAEERHTVLQMQVERLISEVSGASEGDLRVQAQVSTDSLGVLASFINHMIRELGSLVITFKTLANEVERATLQTYDDMTQLVESTDRQVQSIATATANVKEMANESQRVAQRAQALSQVGNEVHQKTQSGRTALQRTIEGMSRINSNVHLNASKIQGLEESSQEINNIARIISGIAHQTNRLALDASIQAAMAGENGKAFRAVADDIRRAAEIAKTQTNIIERIVKRVVEDIQEVTISIRDTEAEANQGTRYSKEAGTAFEAIFAAIEKQSREIDMINQTARQQLVVSGSVVQMMQSVSTETFQNGQSIREEVGRMQRVAHMAEQLLLSAEAFKLSEDQDIFAAINENNDSVRQPAVGQRQFPQQGYQNEAFSSLQGGSRPYFKRKSSTLSSGPQTPLPASRAQPSPLARKHLSLRKKADNIREDK